MRGAPKVFTDHQGDAFALPAPPGTLVALQQRLGKTAEPEKLREVLRGWCRAHLAEREGMQPVVVIPALKRVPAPPVVIQARRSCYQERRQGLPRVVEALQQIAPPRVLVDLVEHEEALVPRQRRPPGGPRRA